MFVTINTSHLQFNGDSKRRFIVFIRKYLINTYKQIIINNKGTLDKKLKPFNLNYNDLLNSLSKSVIVENYDYGILVGFSNYHKVGNFKFLSIIKAIDFGSQVTGSPYPLFSPIQHSVAKYIDILYGRFIGVR